ncbi:MAG: DUF554 domain-containing protein [Clostridium sp.]|jgi:uncharacterized membrane protein YqgA involved in biofilm formation|nr:DUF554 domain-containing protein [Clostridium sp.]
MFGTLVNVGTIIIGSILGMIFKKLIKEDLAQALTKVLGLCVIYLGMAGVIKANQPLLVIVSLAIGTFIGETIHIDKKLERFSEDLETIVSKVYTGKIKEGFLTASLLFCIGSMAIIGPIESALTGIHDTLYAKSMLDGIMSIIFASTLGIGVLLSSVSVFVYQGSIAVLAGFLKPFMTVATISLISGVGSLMILGLGINMVFSQNLKISNMLPSILIPLIIGLIQFLI